MKWAAIIFLVIGLPAQANHRSSHARTEFKHEQPCPATGRSSGPCKGYVIDHIKPLACGGADTPVNMQWQTKADAKAKDRVERRTCTR